MTVGCKFHKSERESIFPDAVEVVLFGKQGSSYQDVPIILETLFGSDRIVSDCGVGYEVRIRSCYLTLTLVRADIAPTPQRYNRTLPPDDFTHFLQRINELTSGKSGKMAGMAGLTLGKILQVLKLDAAVEGEVVKSMQENTISKIESKLKYELIKSLPNNRWRIGDTLFGDPTKLDRCLEGSYFRDTPDHVSEADDNQLTSLCHVTPDDGKATFEVIAEIRARFAGIDLTPVDETVELAFPETLKKVEKQMHLLSARMEQRQAGLPVEHDELVLARAHMRVRQDQVV